MEIHEWQKAVHELAKEKGWWPKRQSKLAAIKTVPEKLALVHSEVSEALESYRDGQPEFWQRDSGKPEGFGVEMADAVIRIMDLCEALGIDLQGCIESKHAYNKTRPFRHGGKKA